MSLVVATNVSSLTAQRALAYADSLQGEAMQRLSTGSKINSASDDAAGLAIAQRMTAQVNGLNMAVKNANDGIALTQSIEGALVEVSDMLQRLRELSVQAANDTNGDKDRTYLTAEVTSLLSEINRVATQTKYNDKTVLDGTLSGSLQVGTEATQTISFSVSSIQTSALGTADGGDALSTIQIDSAANAATALGIISQAIEEVAGQRASYGALSNRLEYTVSNLMNVAEFTTAARSRIEDADFAAESARLSKAQVLQQTGTAMLAQANASSQLAIQLIR